MLLIIGDWGCRPLDVLLARMNARGCQADEAAVVAVRCSLFAGIALPRDMSSKYEDVHCTSKDQQLP